jgi:hypothetical protein
MPTSPFTTPPASSSTPAPMPRPAATDALVDAEVRILTDSRHRDVLATDQHAAFDEARRILRQDASARERFDDDDRRCAAVLRAIARGQFEASDQAKAQARGTRARLGLAQIDVALCRAASGRGDGDHELRYRILSDPQGADALAAQLLTTGDSEAAAFGNADALARYLTACAKGNVGGSFLRGR